MHSLVLYYPRPRSRKFVVKYIPSRIAVATSLHLYDIHVVWDCTRCYWCTSGDKSQLDTTARSWYDEFIPCCYGFCCVLPSHRLPIQLCSKEYLVVEPVVAVATCQHCETQLWCGSVQARCHHVIWDLSYASCHSNILHPVITSLLLKNLSHFS